MIPLFLDNVSPYSLDTDENCRFFKEGLFKMHMHQVNNCKEYRNLATNFSLTDRSEVSKYPFVPVTMFKEYDLRSTDAKTKILKSSGTTGQVSRIYVDRVTATRQSLSSYNILSDFIGKEPRPYLVFDAEKTVRGSDMNARGAAIMSLANFASEIYFLMDLNSEGLILLNTERLHGAMDRIGEKAFIAYGFTYILWEVHKELQKVGFSAGPVNSGSLILHSGGWKKMVDLSVSKDEYSRMISNLWGLKEENVIDFYGLIEQGGMLYPDCAAGFKHVPYWADLIIRDADTLKEAGVDETGLIQLLSLLPLSSPSHSILTQDVGRIEFPDNCPCGRRGKAFTFVSRVESSQVRGCSDVYLS